MGLSMSKNFYFHGLVLQLTNVLYVTLLVKKKNISLPKELLMYIPLVEI